ncbi:MAG TPA: TolC family protein, partial [Cytophagales bacterium]|nr:TolC family protein [Cytophagales bacterium]
MSKTSFTYYLGIIACCICVSCSTPKNANNSVLQVPAYYGATKDSSNAAKLNWKQFFNDPTLATLIDSAVANNYDVKVAQQRIQASRAEILYSRGRLLPFLSAVGSIGQRRFGKYTMDGVGNFDTKFSQNITQEQIIPEHLPDYYVGLQASWEIDIWGKLHHRKKAAVARYLASAEGRNWVVTNLVAEVADNYYELLALDIELDIIRETVVLQKNQLSIIMIEKETGRSNELAVQQFKAQLLHYQALETEVVQRVVECENRINMLLGRFPQTIQRDKNIFLNSLPAQVQVGIPTELLSNRPDIKQAEYELIASKLSVKAARRAFYPALNINAGLGFQSFNPAYILSPQSLAYNVLGGLTAPLLNMSALKAEYKNANAAQLQALYQYQKSIINGYIEVSNHLASINNLKQNFTFKNEESQTLTTAITTATDLYATGRAT